MKATRDLRLIEGVITNLPLFRGVAPVHRTFLARQCWALSAARGETVVHAGARVPGAFALAYGTVKLALRNGGGEERLLRVAAARQVFAEAAALLGQPVPYQAVALADSRLVVIPSAALFMAIERDPGFARGLLVSLARRNFELCADVSAGLLPGLERLAAYLLALLPLEGTAAACVQLPSTKTLVAARLGMKKETLSRLLARLSREQLIRVGHREIAILDRERLLKLRH